MKNMFPVATLIGALVFVSTAGCGMRPRPPMTRDRKTPDVLYINAKDDGEQAAATAMETARVKYKYRLEVLRSCLLEKGYLDEYNWAGTEIKNLQKATTFRWGNLPSGTPPQGEAFALTDAPSLVEDAIAARNAYLAAVEELARFYESKDPRSYKARRVRNTQARFFTEQTYSYFIEAEVPGPELRPAELIPEAEQLYKQAMKLHKWGQLGPGITNYRKQREALRLLLRLVREHPTSTKISLSAFYIATIYKEYFREYVLAVQWYERAWQWDPTVPEAARFEAAVVYDVALQDYTKAAELYRESLLNDPPRLGNADFAKRRIQELREQGEIPAVRPQPEAAGGE